MITDKQAEYFVSHLKDLHGFPDDKWMRRKLVKVLVNYCSSENHAELALDEALAHGNGFCPTVPDLIAACKRIGPRPKTAEQIRREKCEICNGMGFVVGGYMDTVDPDSGRVEREKLTENQRTNLIAKGVGYDPDRQAIFEAATPCSCRAPVAVPGRAG